MCFSNACAHKSHVVALQLGTGHCSPLPLDVVAEGNLPTPDENSSIQEAEVTVADGCPAVKVTVGTDLTNPGSTENLVC